MNRYGYQNDAMFNESAWKHVSAKSSISAPAQEHQTMQTWMLSLLLQYEGKESDHVNYTIRMINLYREEQQAIIS